MSDTPVLATAETSILSKAEHDIHQRGVTRRVVLLCLALAILFGYIIPIIDVKLSNTFLGATHLPPGAIAVLLILILIINPLLRLVSQHLTFSRNEALTVYITCLFSCLVPGHGAEGFLIGNLVGPFYYATRENKWLDFLQPYVKPWLTPALNNNSVYNRVVIEGWYNGIGDAPMPWGAWLVPLFAWGALVGVSYVMIGCLSIMLRGQWGEREALAFPLLRLPLELTNGMLETSGSQRGLALPPLFRSPLMWSCFGIAAFIQLLNGLNLYFPDVPPVPLEINTSDMLTDPPWNQLGWIPLRVYPIMIGITYLLNSEVSFSFWVFHWILKAQLILAYYLGFVPNSLPNVGGWQGPVKSFNGYQIHGVYLAYITIIFWTGREHFGHIVRRALHLAPAKESEKTEALSYPLAFWGFIGSFAFMLGWCYFAGISLTLAFVLLASYLIIAIALTRVIVEGGLLFVLHNFGPLSIIAQLIGSGPGTLLSAQNGVVPAAFVQGAFVTDMRGFLMPSFVQGFKLAHDRKIAAKPLLVLIAGCVLITLVMSFWMRVRLGYKEGGLQLNTWFAVAGAQGPAYRGAALTKGTLLINWQNWIWMGVGALTTYGIVLARSRFPWFILHPTGYLMSLTGPVQAFWVSIFIGWACKVLILRFGGIESYRKITPAFLGLALGDVSTMLFWLIIDGWQGRTGHQLMPG